MFCYRGEQCGPELKEEDLRNWHLLDQFRRWLKPFVEATAADEEDPRRKVLAEDYFCLMLFGLFNPALKSMCALCHASDSLKGSLANLFIPPLTVTGRGRDTLLDFGSALASQTPNFTFPVATNILKTVAGP